MGGTLEMFLINCEIELALTFSANCTICKVDTATTVAITDTKLYVSLFPGGHYENFVQLILHIFFWLRSPRRQTSHFQYRLLSRKIIDLENGEAKTKVYIFIYKMQLF